jgi:hypothetical protein
MALVFLRTGQLYLLDIHRGGERGGTRTAGPPPSRRT